MRNSSEVTRCRLAADTAEAVTVVGLANQYLIARQAEHAPITQRHYAGSLRRLAEFADLPIEVLTPARAQAIYDSIREAHGVHTADKAIKLAGAAWTRAAQLDQAPQHNPWRAVRKVPKKQRPIYFPSGWLPKVLALLDRATAAGLIEPWAARPLAVCLATGARPDCEVLELRTDDVDLAAEVIVIRAGKNKTARLIPLALLGEVGRRSLEAQLAITDVWLWPSPKVAGARMSDKPLRTAWHTLRDLAGADGLRTTTLDGKPLDLYAASRHAVASFAGAELGLSLAQVAALLGHSVKTLEKHYLHLRIAHAQGAAETIGRAYDAARRPMDAACKYGLDTAALVAARKAKGWTLQQAAEACGAKSKQTFSNWELGKCEPSLEQAQRFAESAGVALTALLHKGAA